MFDNVKRIKEKEIIAVMQQMKELQFETEKNFRPRRDLNTWPVAPECHGLEFRRGLNFFSSLKLQLLQLLHITAIISFSLILFTAVRPTSLVTNHCPGCIPSYVWVHHSSFNSNSLQTFAETTLIYHNIFLFSSHKKPLRTDILR